MDAGTMDVALKVAALILTLANLVWGVNVWLTKQENEQRKADRDRISRLERERATNEYVADVERRAANALTVFREDMNKRLDLIISLVQR